MKNNNYAKKFLFIFLFIAACYVLFPIVIVFMNSFKSRLFISDSAFSFPTKESFVGLYNYISGIKTIKFFSAFGYSFDFGILAYPITILFISSSIFLKPL